MALATVDDEQQARLCGRALAKEIFRPMQWKRIGTLPDEDAKLYENLRRRGEQQPQQHYCLRAVRPLNATIAEVEAVLTGATATLRKPNSPPLLARLLPATYISGGRVVRYPQLEHSTSEREHVCVEYARLRPYTESAVQSAADTSVDAPVENHVLLGYTLATRLQRSNTSKKPRRGSTEEPATTQTQGSSVPSLLHLYRPACAPSFAQRRPDFRRDALSSNDFSVTYIIQDATTTDDAGEPQESSVSLEVVLTCSLEPRAAAESDESEHERVRAYRQQQKQRLRHDALGLTRLQPFVNAFRQEKARAAAQSHAEVEEATVRGQPQQFHLFQPQADSAAVKPLANGCSGCRRRFGPFRWKRHCELCNKPICSQCLSVLATPSLTRRKKRVCTTCLYGETGIHTQPKPKQAEAVEETGDIAHAELTLPAAKSSKRDMDEDALANLDRLVKSGPVTTSERATAPGGRLDLDLDAALAAASTWAPPVPEWRRPKQQPSEPRRASLQIPNSAGFYNSDGESAITASARSRRAQTVVLDDVATKAVTRTRTRTRGASATSLPAVVSAGQSDEEVEVDVDVMRETERSLPRTQSACKMQFVHLKTPEPDYELDFNWYNTFPKAPVARGSAREAARARYVEISGLGVDAHALVFLRHDAGLEDIARRVLELASQWQACSLNLVAGSEVYCLVTAATQPEESCDGEDDSELELDTPGVALDDAMPREESVSSYAVYHSEPFFVAELEHDPRFRGHPLHSERGAVSLLSFPILSSGASTSVNGPSSTDITHCVATLDLWKCGRVPASSHVSREWLNAVDALLREAGARLEALARESHAFLKPRARAGYSVGSSCDSRGSTRRADSIDMELELYDIDSEAVVDSPPLSHVETLDRLTSLSYAKVRGLGLGGGAGPQSWKYDSDNESTTSSQSASSATSQNSRFSAHRYSAADMHSTIESLLQQATQTSKYISETGVAV